MRYSAPAPHQCAYECEVPGELAGDPSDIHIFRCTGAAPPGGYCALHDHDDNKPLQAFLKAVDEQMANPCEEGIQLAGTIFPSTFPAHYFSNLTLEAPLCLRAARFRSRAFFEDSTFVEVDLSDAAFEAPVDFNRSVFRGEIGCVTFSGAQFSGAVGMLDVEFDGVVGCVHARFKDAVGLHGSIMRSLAVFMSTRFDDYANFGGVRFEDSAEFDGARFGGDALFDGAQFGTERAENDEVLEASFQEVLFQRKADFRDCHFHSEIRFDRCRFDGNALFLSACFEESVDFRYALFKDGGFFENAILPKSAVADFRYARADSPGTLHFVGNDLARVRLAHADVEDWYLGDVQWPKASRLLSRLVRYKLATNAVFDEVEAPRVSSEEAIEVLYRRLRANYEAGRGYGEAGDFHVGEMEMRRHGLSWANPDRYLLGAYRFLSYYGESWLWALGILLLLMVFSAIVIVITSSDVGFGKALVYVLRVVTLQRPTELTPASIIGSYGLAALTIAGPVQIALMLLAVRRRVQR